MNKSQFANFANIIQLSDLKQPVSHKELKSALKQPSDPKQAKRLPAKDRLAGWSDGPYHLQARRSVLENSEMSPAKVRSKITVQAGSGKPQRKGDFKTMKTELDLSPLRLAVARKSKKSHDTAKDLPSFVIHEAELGLN